MTHTILDSQGQEMGTLTLPDEYTDDQVAAALAIYSTPPVVPTATQIVAQAIQDATDFGNALVLQAATENVLMAITAAGKTKEVQDFLGNLRNYLETGALYAAITEITNLAAGTIPDDIATWVSVARLNVYLNRIQGYLEIPLTTLGGSS